MSPSVEIIAASIPKKGHRPDENEDAWAVHRAGDAVFAAVADGATESVYAGRWAEALARCLMEPKPWRTWLDTETPPMDVLHEQVARARAAWSESVDAATSSRDVPWYVTEKREQGAFATLLGIALVPPAPEDKKRRGRILAASVGDCGLFRMGAEDTTDTGQGTRWAWPHDDPDTFTNRPELVSSRASGPDATIQFHAGEWTPGDVFVLATDAVASWLLRETPALPATDAAAETWLREAQSDKRLRNDDSTIVILQT